MPVVTLTTDWGIKDFYVGALKGALLTELPTLNIVDISHFAHPFDLLNGAFIFRNAWKHFPTGTVHIIGLISEAEKEAELIAVKYQNHFFIGLNDGFFSLAFDETPSEIVSLFTVQETKTSLYEKEVSKAAVFLANGGDFYLLGSKVENFVQRTHLQPVIEENAIRGTVIYLDEFQNVITNINKEIFERMGTREKFVINARRDEYIITSLSNKYSDVPRGHLLALFNSAGYLEIALNQGNAAGLLGMSYGDIVRIDFK